MKEQDFAKNLFNFSKQKENGSPFISSTNFMTLGIVKKI